MHLYVYNQIMSNQAVNMTQKQKLAPEHVRQCLSRDVHAILSVCIHQFKEDDAVGQERCFDVDAVITGKSVAPRIRYEERVTPAAWSKGATPVGSDRPFSRSNKGNFIPVRHFSALA